MAACHRIVASPGPTRMSRQTVAPLARYWYATVRVIVPV